MLEHHPVVTLGRRGGLSSDDAARTGAVEVVETRRGGLATYHGPGQLVGYLIVDLERRGWTTRGLVRGVEHGIITWLGEAGVEAGLRKDAPGVWVGHNKICAVGLHVRKKVTMHGFALNLRTDLRGFHGFTPCGITSGGVTSLEVLLGAAPAPAQVAQEVGLSIIQGIVSQHV